MSTNSANRKIACKSDVSLSLSPVNETERGNRVQAEANDKIPVTECRTEISLGSSQVPVFNIHVNVTPIINESNNSSSVQPVIHLHLGELISKLSSQGVAETLKIESTTLQEKKVLEVDCNNKKRSTLNEAPNIENNKTSQKSSCSSSKKNKLETEKPKGGLKSVKKPGEHSRNLFCEKQLPVRRSIRLENNRKLLKTLEELNANKSVVTKDIGEETVKNTKEQIKSSLQGNPFGLKQLVVILHDIRKAVNKKGVTVCDDMINVKQEDILPVDIDSSDINIQGKVEKNSCNSLRECDMQISVVSKSKEQDSKESPSQQNVTSVSNFGKGYSFGSSSDNEANNDNCEVTGLANKNSHIKELKKSIQDTVDSDTGFSDYPCDVKGGLDVPENNEVQKILLIVPQKQKMTTLMSSDQANLPSEEKDASVNFTCMDAEDNTPASLNPKSKESNGSLGSKCGSNDSDASSDNKSDSNDSDGNSSNKSDSNNSDGNSGYKSDSNDSDGNSGNKSDSNDSDGNSGNKSDSNDSDGNSGNKSDSNDSDGSSDNKSDSNDSDESHSTNFEKDNHQTASERHLDVEKDNVCARIKSKNPLKSSFEDNKVLNDHCKVNVSSPLFQLLLIKKEMAKRNLPSNNRKITKKGFKEKFKKVNEDLCQVVVNKEKKLSEEIAEEGSTAKDLKKVSPESDFIPLMVSGPTKFAVAQINKMNPYNTHKAHNFKKEKLFGEAVKRHLNPNQLQINLLKKQAAKKRRT